MPEQQTSSRASFSIDEFCRRNGFSRSFFYALKRRGQAPDIAYLGNLQRITLESEAALVARMRRSQHLKERNAWPGPTPPGAFSFAEAQRKRQCAFLPLNLLSRQTCTSSR